MSASSTRKQCTHDNGCKQTAVTNCEGCSKAFCIKHFTDHRRLLEEEMNMIIDEHDSMKNILDQQISKPECHPLIKQVDQWEEESIGKIKQRANELREELLQPTVKFANNLSKKLQQLSGKLRESRENDSFIEADFQIWKKTLADLKTKFTAPSKISINPRNNISLVENIFTNVLAGTNDTFQYSSDNAVKIVDNGLVAARNRSQQFTGLRGKKNYITGRHNIRLRIERYKGNWIFFGINSKENPLRDFSHISKSAYGWSNNNCVWLAGMSKFNCSYSSCEIKADDTITLIFDCDNRRICMINERTRDKNELVVDTNNCPFPWQLHIVLYEPNTRVRILPNQ